MLEAWNVALPTFLCAGHVRLALVGIRMVLNGCDSPEPDAHLVPLLATQSVDFHH